MVCGDGDYDALALVDLAMRAGWPVLAEPSSGARRGPNALSAYQYLLATPEFVAAHQPDLIVSAGRPGLSRAQLAFLGAGSAGRHVVIAQGPGSLGRSAARRHRCRGGRPAYRGARRGAQSQQPRLAGGLAPGR